jgi:hypothetical protein
VVVLHISLPDQCLDPSFYATLFSVRTLTQWQRDPEQSYISWKPVKADQHAYKKVLRSLKSTELKAGIANFFAPVNPKAELFLGAPPLHRKRPVAKKLPKKRKLPQRDPISGKILVLENQIKSLQVALDSANSKNQDVLRKLNSYLKHLPSCESFSMIKKSCFHQLKGAMNKKKAIKCTNSSN